MRLALCLEQTLGHRAHSANLEGALARAGHDSVVIKVDPSESRLVPWAAAGSWRALTKLRAEAPDHRVRFFHTQSIALFAPVMRNRTPFVVSVDATPIQMDSMGGWYGHQEGRRVTERAKQSIYRAVFSRAAAMVAWSEWAASSLAEDYGVAPERILVAHPGAPAEFFAIPDRHPGENRRPTVLFVGGDLERKGGDLLLEAFEAIKCEANLILVTTAHIDDREGIDVIRDAKPGSPELVDAYRRADIFCLPTRGDCTPVVLGEAMASGLPVITTRVGSNEETVTDEVDGLVINVDDGGALRATLARLIRFPEERTRMGAAARAKALRRFDSERNAAKIFRLLESLA